MTYVHDIPSLVMGYGSGTQNEVSDVTRNEFLFVGLKTLEILLTSDICFSFLEEGKVLSSVDGIN